MAPPLKPGTEVLYHTADGDLPGKVINAAYPATIEEHVTSTDRDGRIREVSKDPDAPKEIQIGSYDGKLLGDKVVKRAHPQAGQQMTAPKYKDEYDNEMGGEPMALIEYVERSGRRTRVTCAQGDYHGMFSLVD